MKRQVFIIKGYSRTEEELETDRYYADKYIFFFNGNSGGAYEEDEISYYEDISANDLKLEIEELDLDFAIIVLIGHGASQDDKQLFKLNENEIIKAGQLELNIAKQLIILESCRSKIENVYTVDLNDKIPKFKYGGIVRRSIDGVKARELYNEKIIECGCGTVVCFACSDNETAKNYYFSFILIQIAFNWHLEHWHHFETLTITQLMPSVAEEVNRLAIRDTNEGQNPEIMGNIDFPFSVSKF